MRALYDNPETSRRELWVNGVLAGFISLEAMQGHGFNGVCAVPDCLDSGQWEPGKVKGDADALPNGYRRQS